MLYRLDAMHLNETNKIMITILILYIITRELSCGIKGLTFHQSWNHTSYMRVL